MNTRTPVVINCFSAYAVSMASRPSRDSSDMISTWNGGRGFSEAMSRTNPGQFANSAPLIPSSTKSHVSGPVQPLRVA